MRRNRKAPTPKRGGWKHATPEERQEAVDLSLRVGIDAAAREKGVSPSTIFRWRTEAGVRIFERTPQAERDRAVELAEEIGVAEAAEQLGVSIHAIYRWRSQAGLAQPKREFTDEEREGACKYAAETTARIAAEAYDVDLKTIYSWRQMQTAAKEVADLPNPLEGVRAPGERWTDEANQIVVEVAEEMGVYRAAAVMNIPYSTVYDKLRDVRGSLAPTEEERLLVRRNAVARAEVEGPEKVAAEHDVTVDTVKRWVREHLRDNGQKEPPVLIGKKPRGERATPTHREEMAEWAWAVGDVMAADHANRPPGTLTWWRNLYGFTGDVPGPDWLLDDTSTAMAVAS